MEYPRTWPRSLLFSLLDPCIVLRSLQQVQPSARRATKGSWTFPGRSNISEQGIPAAAALDCQENSRKQVLHSPFSLPFHLLILLAILLAFSKKEIDFHPCRLKGALGPSCPSSAQAGHPQQDSQDQVQASFWRSPMKSAQPLWTTCANVPSPE